MVGPGYEQALGSRIVAINGVPIARARELAATLTPVAETTGLQDLRIDAYLSIGKVLHGLDITQDRNSAQYLLATDDGRQITVQVSAVLPGEEPKWINASSSVPLSEQPVTGSGACTLLVTDHMLYCNIRMILQLESVSNQMLKMLQEDHPDKLVIDLRHNGGGDYNLGLRYLIDPISKDKSINRPGHLFVLIGPDTFSAAMSNAAQFRSKTHATLVGQQVGERPTSYQEPREFTLPPSPLIVRYSTKYYSFSNDSTNVLAPDQKVATTWADYKAGQDPALDWIILQKK